MSCTPLSRLQVEHTNGGRREKRESSGHLGDGLPEVTRDAASARPPYRYTVITDLLFWKQFSAEA